MYSVSQKIPHEQNSNLCDHDTSTSQADGQTGGQLRAVIILKRTCYNLVADEECFRLEGQQQTKLKDIPGELIVLPIQVTLITGQVSITYSRSSSRFM